MNEKLNTIKSTFQRVVTSISIASTLSVHIIYLAYLVLALKNEIGNRTANLALISATLIFLGLYLILRPGGGRFKGGLRLTKKFYRYFRLLTRMFSAGAAIYTLATAVGSLSVSAILLSVLGLVFFTIRIALDLVIFAIKRGARRFKDTIMHRDISYESPDGSESPIEITPEDFSISNADSE